MSVNALTIPNSNSVVTALDSKQLFAESVDGFMEQVWTERERRLRTWVADGWTQTRIAQEVGRSQKSVSLWLARFAIDPVSSRGRPRKSELEAPSNSGPEVRHAEPKRKPRTPKSEAQLVDYLPDLVPGATREGAFRQAVLAWCKQEHTLWSELESNRTLLTPKSDYDREALLEGLAHVHRTATRLERQLTHA